MFQFSTGKVLLHAPNKNFLARLNHTFTISVKWACVLMEYHKAKRL